MSKNIFPNLIKFKSASFSLLRFITQDFLNFLNITMVSLGLNTKNKKIKYTKKRNSRKNSVHFLSLVILFNISSCSYYNDIYSIIKPNTDRVYFDYTITQPDKYSLVTKNHLTDEAVKNWNSFLQKELFCYNCSDYNITIFRLDDLRNVSGFELNPRTTGLTYRYDSECVIYLKKNDNELETLIHELGHCIGFGHSEDSKSIMSSKLTGNNVFTEDIKNILENVYSTYIIND